jgi:hypothetical protein
MIKLKQRCCLVAMLLALAAHPIGCTSGSSSEGGIVGSGISSIQGNVVDVEIAPETASASVNRDGGASTGAILPTVVVSVDETDSETTTDADGAFRLEGNFAGTTTVRFRDQASDATLGTLVVEIGAGATVVLPDIEIRTDLPEDARVQVRPPLQINLFGRVTTRDCDGGQLEIEDESAGRNHFVVRLRDDTDIVDADDSAAVACDRIRIDDRITVVEGIVDRDAGLIEAIKVRLQPIDPVPPRTIRVRRRGTVLRAACGRGFVYFQDSVPNDLVSARIDRATDITCGSPERICTCADIAPGDMIDVSGTRRVDDARPIDAARIHVTPSVAPTFVSTAAGDVISIDCDAGTLRASITEVAGDAVRPQDTVIALTDDTAYRCFGDLSCTCADVRARDRIALDVLVSVDDATAPQALTVTVVSAARVRLAGVIEVVECGAGRLRVAPDAEPLTAVEFQLTRATQFTLPDGSATTCRSLSTGTRAGVGGHVERGQIGAVRRNVADLVHIERQRR